MYSVNLWCSKPWTNDDCNTGDDFETLAEAEAVFANPTAHFKASSLRYTAWFELTGPDVDKERQNPDYKVERSNDDEWRSEYAMQAGMMGGCDAYNDAYGY